MEGRTATAVALVLAAMLALVAPAAAGDDHQRERDGRRGRGITQADPVDTFGSVEPIANPAVFDTRALRDRDLRVQGAFAERVLECGIVKQVVEALTSTGAVTTINRRNTTFAVGAGGFAGGTSPAIVYTVVDSGRGAASHEDIEILTNSLGYVFSQFSTFLLDGDGPGSFDFPANYLILDFDEVPSLEESAALFEMVGRIDPELFETDTSGYTQYGRSYLTLQSAVPDEQFIAGYVRAARKAGVDYRPIVDGQPGLFRGGAAFPANDWTDESPEGEDYLSRIPDQSHQALRAIRDGQLRLTESALRLVERSGEGRHADRRVARAFDDLPCRSRHWHHGGRDAAA